MSFTISDGSSSTKPNGRLGSRKSRRGCLTCKRRKVKCDEKQPVCARCVAGGHTCRGYDDPFVSNDKTTLTRVSRSPSSCSPAQTSIAPSRSISPLLLDSSNLRAAQFFWCELSEALGGPLGAAFWRTSVLQISHSEPAVQQALTAVSTLYEHAQRSDRYARCPRSSLAAQRYNTALATTAQRVAQGDGDTVALITCILFLCFEFIQRNQVGAFTLLSKGANILHGVMRQCQTPPSPYPSLLHSTILPVFERLSLLSALYGFPLPPFPRGWDSACIDEAGAPTEFATLDEANILLYWRMVNIHDLIRRSGPYRDCVTGPDERFEGMLVEQARHLDALEVWRTNLVTLSTMCNQSEDKDLKATLRMYYALTKAWLSCALQPLETAYDDQNDLFEIVVTQAEELAESRRVASDRHSFFSFEMGVIPPLYMTVIKCRDPGIRARALNNLYRAPAQESLWTRAEAIRVAERTVAIEHELSQCRIPGSFETLPAPGRISEVKIFGEKEQGWQVWFYMKVDGHGEVHRCWSEIVT